MRTLRLRSTEPRGFTFVEICVALAICVLFGTAVFATNQRLLLALKTQKEQTAATLMMQERMEAFRSLMYSGIAASTTSGTTNPPTNSADIVATTTTSEAGLGNLQETITVSGYIDTSGNLGDGSAKNVWVRNSTYPTGNQTSTNTTLATSYDLIKVDIQIQWTSANGRTRYREMASVFGKGNRGS